jgi:hypothetical protein
MPRGSHSKSSFLCFFFPEFPWRVAKCFLGDPSRVQSVSVFRSLRTVLGQKGTLNYVSFGFFLLNSVSAFPVIRSRWLRLSRLRPLFYLLLSSYLVFVVYLLVYIFNIK